MAGCILFSCCLDVVGTLSKNKNGWILAVFMQFLQATLNFRKFFTPWDMMYACCLMTFTCVGVYLCNKWIHGGIRGLISIQTGDTVNIFVSKEFYQVSILQNYFVEWITLSNCFTQIFLSWTHLYLDQNLTTHWK